MSPQFRSLLMKDWSERRRLFWFGVAILLYLVGYCVAYEVEYLKHALVCSHYNVCLLFTVFGSILMAMLTSSGEYSRQTLRFSSSLPISLFQIAWSRLLVTWFCLVGPMIIGSVVVTLILASGAIEQMQPCSIDTLGRRPGDYLFDRPNLSSLEAIQFLWVAILVVVCVAIYLSTIVSLIGTVCRRETTVGFLGIIVIFTFVMGSAALLHVDRRELFFLSNWIGAILPSTLATPWSYGGTDGSFYTDLELAPLIMGPLLVNLLLSVCLANWFACRYGRRDDVTSTVLRRQNKMFHWLRFIPRWRFRGSSQLGALVWLNARHSIPLCVSGLIIAAIMSSFELLLVRNQERLLKEFFSHLSSVSIELGIFWSAIIAVSVFSSETKPHQDEFWSSKPISAGAWFWLKFWVGFAVLMLTFEIIPMAGVWLCRDPYDLNCAPYATIVATLCCVPLIHAQSYAFSVAAICRLRRPVIAAIVGFLLSISMRFFLESIPVYPSLSVMGVLNTLSSSECNHRPLEFLDTGYPEVYGSIVVMILFATLIARNSIVRTNTAPIGVAALLCLGVCEPVHAQENPSSLATEVVNGIQRLEKSIQVIHMKIATETEYIPPKGMPKRRRYYNSLSTPYHDYFIYDLFQQGQQRAWKKFDTQGNFKSSDVYDGSTSISYLPPGNSIIHRNHLNRQLDFPNPVSLLLGSGQTIWSSSLLELLKARTPNSARRYEAGTERFIELNWFEPAIPHPIPSKGGIKTVNKPGQRFQLIVNADRQYWPVKIMKETLLDEVGNVGARLEISATGWIDSPLKKGVDPLEGVVTTLKNQHPEEVNPLFQRAVESDSVVVPRSVEQVLFQPQFVQPNSLEVKSPELELRKLDKCELLELTVGGALPADTFAMPIPPGVPYFDDQDRKSHEMDESGNVRLYYYKPKGLRGTVFGYFLVSIVIAVIYLLRPSNQ